MSNDFVTDIGALQDMFARSGDRTRPYEFFGLDDGESGTFRIVSGIEDMAVINHKCGLKEYEVAVRVMNQAAQAGSPLACPQCGEVFENSDIAHIRPAAPLAHIHSFVPMSNGKNGKFVCLNELPSNRDEFGKPKVPCPICAVTKKDDKSGKVSKAYPARPMLFGFAIERTKRMKEGMVNGVYSKVLDGIDTLIENDKPRIVLIEKGSKFWNPFFSAYQENKTIAYWDYDITRMGQGTSTTYTVQRVAGDPNIIPFESYGETLAECVESLSGSLEYWASQEYYEKSGWSVGGTMTAPQTEQAAPTAVNPAPPIAGTVSFNDIADRIGDTNGNIANYI